MSAIKEVDPIGINLETNLYIQEFPESEHVYQVDEFGLKKQIVEKKYLESSLYWSKQSKSVAVLLILCAFILGFTLVNETNLDTLLWGKVLELGGSLIANFLHLFGL